ncbi:MAG: cation:proton antiporter [Clostridiales bacterium]|nr:cation:proton antiporter [Clostridiales bacterium]
MNLLLKISIVLVVGSIGGRIAKHFKLPNVSGYLVAGLLLGPSFINLISSQDSNSLTIISEFALAIIAFSIGSEFIIKDMKKLGKSIAIITLAEVIGAVLVVFCVMFYIFKQSFAFSIVIASMSAATAPAATLLVIQQYKAHGPLTKTILPVVALDDVYGIIVFGIAMSVAKISEGKSDLSFIEMLSGPMIEIVGSLILGLILGLLLVAVVNRTKSSDDIQIISLAAIGVAAGLSTFLGFSPLLTNILMGMTLVNLKKDSERVFSTVNKFVPAVYVLFFTLAGASLDLGILATVGIMGIGYVIARAAGKYIGAFVGAKAVRSEKAVANYLGLALLPQGGISIGLSVIVRQQLPEHAVGITTIIMFSILIYEVSGPIFAKIAIDKAGEINGLEKIKEKQNKQGLEGEIKNIA